MSAGLTRVGGGSWGATVEELSADGDANVYLLRGDGASALVDCATIDGRPRIEANLRRAGVEPAELGELLLTHSHWDHSQAAHAWQTSYGLRTHLNAVGAVFLARGDHRLVGVPLHGPDYPFTPFTVDHPIRDGETFDLAGIAVTAKFLPGHTPDSTLFTLELDGARVGIGGDIAFGARPDGVPRLGLLSHLWQSNLDDYVTSLHALASIPLDVLAPGHGPVVIGRDAVRAAVTATLATAERLAADDVVRHNTGI